MSLEDKLYPLLSLYDRLPQGARNFIGTSYRMLPRRIRYGKAYGEFRELADDAPSWSESDISSLTSTCLARAHPILPGSSP